MPSIEGLIDRHARQILRDIAAASIDFGLQRGRALQVVAAEYPPALQAPRATFVTLHKDGDLRGCIGSLEAQRALIVDVAMNAFAAAFRDPRFAPVRTDELAALNVHISVLSPAQPMRFHDEADLLRQLRPGLDGLILEEERHRGTFLPSVWDSLPQPEEFLAHLKLKAGLAADYWSRDIRVARYTTESF
jgi:uncharacterized protein